MCNGKLSFYVLNQQHLFPDVRDPKKYYHKIKLVNILQELIHKTKFVEDKLYSNEKL